MTSNADQPTNLNEESIFLLNDNVALPQLEAYIEFKEKYQRMIKLSAFSPKTKCLLILMIGSVRYSHLTQRQIATITHLDKSTISRVKKEISKETQKQKIQRGPKPKLTEPFFEEILDYAKKKRTEGYPLSLKWFQKTVSEMSEKTISVSLPTVSRKLKKHGWRPISTQAHHPMQLDPKRMQITEKFLYMISDLIKKNHLTREQFHIMDESGVYSNQIPLYTYAPKEDTNGYIRCELVPQRDTIIVTLTANGDAHLFYVEHRSKCILKNKTEKKEIKACKGVGKTEIYEWAKAFVSYAKPGDYLLLDNLGSHKDPVFLSFLEENKINYIFFPIRTADVLSVLDNSFFGAFKNGLRNFVFSGPEDKKEKIIQRFQTMVQQHNVEPFFQHCKYSSMFKDPYVEGEHRAICQIMDPPSLNESWGNITLTTEIDIPNLPYLSKHFLGNENKDSHIKCILSLIFHNSLLRSKILNLKTNLYKPIKKYINKLLTFNQPSSKDVYQKYSGYSGFQLLELLLRRCEMQQEYAEYQIFRNHPNEYTLLDIKTESIIQTYSPLYPLQNILSSSKKAFKKIPVLLFLKFYGCFSNKLTLRFNICQNTITPSEIPIWYNLVHILIITDDKMKHYFKQTILVNGQPTTLWYEQQKTSIAFKVCPIEYILSYFNQSIQFLLVYELEDVDQAGELESNFPLTISTDERVESSPIDPKQAYDLAQQKLRFNFNKFIDQDEVQDEAEDKVHDETEDEAQDEAQDEAEDEVQDEAEDEVQDEAEDEVPDEAEDEVQDEDEAEDEVPDEAEDEVQDEAQDKEEEEEVCDDQMDNIENIEEDITEEDKFEPHLLYKNNLIHFSGPTLCNPGRFCYINVIMQLIYHIPNFRDSILSNDFKDCRELETFKILLKIMNKKMKNIIVSRFYTSENIPFISTKDEDPGLLLSHILSTINDRNNAKNAQNSPLYPQIDLSFCEIEILYQDTSNTDHQFTQLEYIFDLQVIEDTNSLENALEEYLTKSSNIHGSIIGLGEYLIFKLNRRSLERKKFFKLEFNDILDMHKYVASEKECKFLLKFIIVHHGNGNTGGHYMFYIKNKNNQWIEISDKHAYLHNKTLKELNLEGDNGIEKKISSNLLSEKDIRHLLSSKNTAYILVYQSCEKYKPAYNDWHFQVFNPLL